jgi:hypothetical protein
MRAKKDKMDAISQHAESCVFLPETKLESIAEKDLAEEKSCYEKNNYTLC